MQFTIGPLYFAPVWHATCTKKLPKYIYVDFPLAWLCTIVLMAADICWLHQIRAA